jgi:hypothetical protein
MSGEHLQPLLMQHSPVDISPETTQLQPEEAEPSVLAYATSVARRLMEHIAQHQPPSVNAALNFAIHEWTFTEAAIAAAEGRAFSKTATLLQLLPQLAQIATQASAESSQTGLLLHSAGSSSAGPHGTWVDLAYCQQAQEAYVNLQQPDSGSGAPLPTLHSTAVPDPAFGGFVPSAPAGFAAPGAGSASAGCFFAPQQQQPVWDAQGMQWGGQLAVPTVSDCGSTCD